MFPVIVELGIQIYDPMSLRACDKDSAMKTLKTIIKQCCKDITLKDTGEEYGFQL